MTESTTADLPPLIVNGQYIKDLSFEVPGAPAIFGEMQNQSPDIPIHVDIDVSPLRDNLFEVVLHLKVEASLADKPVFIAELAYGGVFTVNLPPEHHQAVLLVECPRLLFPFARTIIADATRDGGFPPLMIQPIDFAQLYRSRAEAMQQDAAGTA
ncbi:MAG: protein-export chaperone SecB [Magnetospirillum sp.]|nr:protein-export chaperone SecB [Magnetospirillum sp.]